MERGRDYLSPPPFDFSFSLSALVFVKNLIFVRKRWKERLFKAKGYTERVRKRKKGNIGSEKSGGDLPSLSALKTASQIKIHHLKDCESPFLMAT